MSGEPSARCALLLLLLLLTPIARPSRAISGVRIAAAGRSWLLKFGNESRSVNASLMCGDGLEAGVPSHCRLEGGRMEEAEVTRAEGAGGGLSWLETLPMPPIAVGRSDALPDGACKRQLKRYIEELGNGRLWAVEMFDSSAKYPYGVIEGHTKHLGNFDQCYRIDVKTKNNRQGNYHETEHIQGRFCLVNFKYEQRSVSSDFHGKLTLDFDPNDSAWEAVREKGDFRRQKRYRLEMALCVPATCTAEDVQTVLQDSYKDYADKNKLAIKINVSKNSCQAYHEEPPLSTGFTVLCGILVILISLIIVSTLYDGTLNIEEDDQEMSRGSQLLLCFSAKRNLQSIFNIKYSHRGLDTIHLIRFFLTTLVFVGHRIMHYYNTGSVNTRYLELSFHNPSFIIFHNSTIIVDGFFGIGGLLTCYSLLNHFQKTKRMNFISLTLIRLIRLTPTYLLLLFFTVYIFKHMGSGPFWHETIIVEAENCGATWWANLLYLNNYISMDRLCIFQSWYMSVDFHCYLIASFIIYGFWKSPRKIGYSLLGMAIFISLMIPFYITYIHRLQPYFIGYPYLEIVSEDEYFIDYYVKTHMRMSAYFIGVICGAILYDYEQNATWRISKRWSQWLFVLLVVVLSLSSQALGVPFLDPNSKPSPLQRALYACLHRPAFAFSFCAIILLITMGDGLESYECVQKFVKTSGKRIKIPKLSKSILETSNGDSSNSAEDGELKQIQKKKKDTKLKKCLAKKNIDQNIIATYVENRKCEANNEIILQSSSPSNFAHSTFTENHQNLRSTTPVLELLDEQINNYVTEPVNCTTQENNKVALNGEIGNSIPLKNKSFQNEFIEIYDKIFDIDLKNQIILENNTYLTLIDKGVYCNTRAYKDAFKTKDPQRFFTLINSGIYGYEDLSKRSVKEPKKKQCRKNPFATKEGSCRGYFLQIFKSKRIFYFRN